MAQDLVSLHNMQQKLKQTETAKQPNSQEWTDEDNAGFTIVESKKNSGKRKVTDKLEKLATNQKDFLKPGCNHKPSKESSGPRQKPNFNNKSFAKKELSSAKVPIKITIAKRQIQDIVKHISSRPAKDILTQNSNNKGEEVTNSKFEKKLQKMDNKKEVNISAARNKKSPTDKPMVKVECPVICENISPDNSCTPSSAGTEIPVHDNILESHFEEQNTVCEKLHDEPIYTALVEMFISQQECGCALDQVFEEMQVTPEIVRDEEVVNNSEVVETKDVIVNIKTPLKKDNVTAKGNVECLSPYGTLRYSKDFLLGIQRNIKMMKPSLPDLDIVLNVPHLLQMTPMNPKVSVQTRDWNLHQYSNGKNQRVIDIKIDRNIVLHQSEKAWKGLIKQNKGEIDTLLNKLRGILNKITPQCFDTLVEQVKDLYIDSVEKLTGCIDLLFDQCVKQPFFSAVYANMAKCFSKLSVSSDEDPTKIITFRKLLLIKCQQEFEQDKENEKALKDILEKVKNAQSDKEKKQLEDRKAETMVEFKRRSLGNVKFIGELFKLSILTENIMHECLVKLLKGYEDEDNLECLCKLLTTIGKTLDNPKQKSKVDAYFIEMKKLVDNKMTSTRIRFMIMDVTDLRKGGWIPKRNEGPKTIDQVHKEAEIEKLVVQMKMEESNRGETRQVTRYNKSVPAATKTDDEWTKISVPLKPESFDVNKLKLTKMSDNIQLGPGRATWNRGSTGGAPKKEPQLLWNKYQVLSYGGEVCDTVEEGKVPTSKTHINQTPKKVLLPAKNNEDLVMSKDEIKRKVKLIIEEYLISKDINETYEAVKELKTEFCFKSAVNFIYYSVEQNIEKTTKILDEIGVLHQYLLKSGAIPLNAYASAVKKLTRLADDLSIDVPQVWKYIGEIVCPVFLDGSPFKMNILVPEISENSNLESDDEFESEENDNLARLFAMILNAVSHKMGHHQASELWESSGLQWKKFVKNQPLQNFLDKFVKL